jgi:hypothetical protein
MEVGATAWLMRAERPHALLRVAHQELDLLPEALDFELVRGAVRR